MPHLITFIIIRNKETAPASAKTRHEGLEMVTATVKKKRTFNTAFKLKGIDTADKLGEAPGWMAE